MVKRSALRGYLLEEALAWLLRQSGYRLLVSARQDPVELLSEGNTLRVRGRGAVHQVDVLGEFPFTPAFSLPVRLFLEAKFYRDPCGLDVVRNAHGVVHDVNENFMSVSGSRPRRRYTYSYVLFSANGFTAPAQEYALAHQISLVDLSGHSFSWLRDAVGSAAAKLYDAQLHYGVTTFPVSWMRWQLRNALGTSPEPTEPPVTGAQMFRATAEGTLETFADSLHRRHGHELLLGFPAAPFVLPLASSDRDAFLSHADLHPDHAVRLRRVGAGDEAEWLITPQAAGTPYQLTFKLPDHVEKWIGDIADEERARTLLVKQQFLATITVYRVSDSGLRSYLLRYEPADIRRR